MNWHNLGYRSTLYFEHTEDLLELLSLLYNCSLLQVVDYGVHLCKVDKVGCNIRYQSIDYIHYWSEFKKAPNPKFVVQIWKDCHKAVSTWLFFQG